MLFVEGLCFVGRNVAHACFIAKRNESKAEKTYPVESTLVSHPFAVRQKNQVRRVPMKSPNGPKRCKSCLHPSSASGAHRSGNLLDLHWS